MDGLFFINHQTLTRMRTIQLTLALRLKQESISVNGRFCPQAISVDEPFYFMTIINAVSYFSTNKRLKNKGQQDFTYLGCY